MTRSNKSAGILAYRITTNGPEFLLAHPGGPYFIKKDHGVWSIPKGEYDDSEDAFTAAQREFHEETNLQVSGTFTELKPVKLKSGKTVRAWAIETDLDLAAFKSNTFPLEWPPKSGKFQDVVEVDKIEWLSAAIALQKINERQAAFIHEIMALINQK